MASFSKGEVNSAARLAMSSRRGKGGVSEDSEFCQLRSSRMRKEEPHRLGCIQVLQKMSQFDFEEFPVEVIRISRRLSLSSSYVRRMLLKKIQSRRSMLRRS